MRAGIPWGNRRVAWYFMRKQYRTPHEVEMARALWGSIWRTLNGPLRESPMTSASHVAQGRQCTAAYINQAACLLFQFPKFLELRCHLSQNEWDRNRRACAWSFPTNNQVSFRIPTQNLTHLILCSALDGIKECSKVPKQWRNIRKEHKAWKRELIVQEMILRLTLEKLLLPLVPENQSQTLDDLLNDPAGSLWSEPSLVQKLNERLRFTLDQYLEVIQALKESLEELSTQLGMNKEHFQNILLGNVGDG